MAELRLDTVGALYKRAPVNTHKDDSGSWKEGVVLPSVSFSYLTVQHEGTEWCAYCHLDRMCAPFHGGRYLSQRNVERARNQQLEQINQNTQNELDALRKEM